jgi:AraC-like DNA-binding protein
MGLPFAGELQSLKDLPLSEAVREAPLPHLHSLSDDGFVAASKVFHLDCQSVHVIALSGPATTAKLARRRWLSLIHVESGEVDLLDSEHSCFASAGDWLLVPCCGAVWKSSTFHVICVMVSPEEIAQILPPSGSEPAGSAPLTLPDGPCAVLSSQGDVRSVVILMVQALLQTASQLHRPYPELLERLAIGDQLCRLMAVLICPSGARQSDADPRPEAETHGRDSFEELIDYIKANLDQPLNLTLLANQSHYSRRALQYTFRDRLGCTATQWIRSQRLDLAQKRLLSAQPGDTVTRIALACGYRSLSLFSIEFQQRFHLKPSVLLRRTRSGQEGAASGEAAEQQDSQSPR